LIALDELSSKSEELMTVQLDVRLSAPQRWEIEEKMRAAEAWNDLFRENTRLDVYFYGQSKRVLKQMPGSGSQLSLWPENDPLSER
jgi:hypothetical protein